VIRLRAVHALLFDDVAELRLESSDGPSSGPGGEPAGADDPAGAESRWRAAIQRARGRAALVAALDLVAVLVLFIFRRESGPFLVLGESEEGLFTVGVLAIAVHAGYRLGQRQKLGAVLRAWDALPGRYDGAPVGRSA
jgi:hypothetical protein